MSENLITDGLKLTYRLDRDLDFIGMEQVVAAELYGIDNRAALDREMIEFLAESLRLAGELDDEGLASDPILNGYRRSLKLIGRSEKKFPPSAAALIGILQRTRRFPDVNTAVNIYNAHVVRNKLSLGVHDIDKLCGAIHFRLSAGNELFVPIGGGEKYTAKGDYLYADDKTVLAWLDARDSELVKISSDTKNLVIIAQGNAGTSVSYRMQALRGVCEDILRCCGGFGCIGAISPAGGR